MTDDHTNPTDEQLLRLLQSPRVAGFLRAASPWMGPQETAAYLGIALGTLRNWTSARYIPFSRRGRVVRYHRGAIDRWLSKGGCEGRTTLADMSD
jgi:excisionase family DNA binding protein